MSKSPTDSTSDDRPPLRLLALDDSLTIRKLIELVARSEDCELELAADGAEGIEAATERPPDLMLLDYLLPDMRGTEVCAQLARQEDTKEVPVVVMSGKGDDVVAHFEGFGQVVGYLHKPFPPDALREFLARARAGELSVDEPIDARAALPSARATDAAPALDADAEAAPAPTVRQPSRERTAEAAQVLFRALRDGLERIPEWSAERAGRPAAAFFATKLLTPKRVEALLAGLEPVLLQPASGDAPANPGGANQR